MSEELMFRIDSSIELDYIKKGICPFCKQKVDVSEFKNRINGKQPSGLRFIKRTKMKHFKENERCRLAR